MGCTHSKTKKKTKERSTLSQEGARETARERQAAAKDELFSRQSTSALQECGMQPKDTTGQEPAPAPQVLEALEVPVPHQTAMPNGTDVDVQTPAVVANSTAKPDGAPPAKSSLTDAKRKGSNGRARGHRASSHSIKTLESSSNISNTTSQTSSSHDEGRRGKHRNSDRYHRRHSHAGESASESASASRSLGRSDAKSKKKKSNTKKKTRRSKSSSSSSSEEEHGGLAVSSHENELPPGNSIAFEKEPSAGAQGRPKTRFPSTSGSSVSFEFQSNSSPSAVAIAAQHPSGSGSVIVSSSPRSVGVISSRGHAGDTFSNYQAASPAVVAPSAPSLLAATVDNVRVPRLSSPASASSANTSRLPYEPYNDFGPADGDDQLPPYEWVPSAMPVSSLLRLPEMNPTATAIAGHLGYRALDSSVAVVEDRGNVAVSVPPFTSYRNDTTASHWDRDAAQPSARFYDPAVDVEDGGVTSPLMPRTFYPHLPPVEWPTYAPAAPASRLPSSEVYYRNEENVPLRKGYEEEYGGDDADTYDDTQALYSPADAVAGARESRFGASAPRRLAPPSLVDAYVSNDVEDDNDGGVRQPRSSAGYHEDYYVNAPPRPPFSSLSYSRPKISILPSPYAYGPSPMVSAASVASAEENDAYMERSENRRLTHGGVGVHQYKPVTYLFDNSMDNWLQSRRTVAPQRELYADAADMW
jgi:hypothetical protein